MDIRGFIAYFFCIYKELCYTQSTITVGESDRDEIAGRVTGHAGGDDNGALELRIVASDPGMAQLVIQAAQGTTQPEWEFATQHESLPGRKRRGIQAAELVIIEIVIVQDTVQKCETILRLLFKGQLRMDSWTTANRQRLQPAQARIELIERSRGRMKRDGRVHPVRCTAIGRERGVAGQFRQQAGEHLRLPIDAAGRKPIEELRQVEHRIRQGFLCMQFAQSGCRQCKERNQAGHQAIEWFSLNGGSALQTRQDAAQDRGTRLQCRRSIQLGEKVGQQVQVIVPDESMPVDVRRTSTAEQNCVRAAAENLELLALRQAANVNEKGELPAFNIGAHLPEEGIAERAFPTNDLSYLLWRLLRPMALTVGRGTHDVVGNAILAQGARQTICQYRFASMWWTTNQHGWLRVFLSFHCLTPDEIFGERMSVPVMSEYGHTLVASVGGQPQIVTLTLDLLLRQAVPIDEVVVLHPAPTNTRLLHTLDCLRAEFAHDRYTCDGRTLPCRLQLEALSHDGEPLPDVTDTSGAHATRDAIHYLLRRLKLRQRHIHLSASGGRRVISLMAISAAQLHFDSFDRIWHIYTPPEARAQVNEGARMHVPSEAGIRLIEVPFVPWGAFFPPFSREAESA